MPLWKFPLRMEVLDLTDDSESFRKIDITKQVEIPFGEHCGAFGAKRKHDVHGGVDLYCPEGTPVYAVEDGIPVLIEAWTGKKAGCDWWEDTEAVLIAGESGVVAYGEIDVSRTIKIGEPVLAGDLVGYVKRVLKKDKGRPRSMLHLHLYRHGKISAGGWELDQPQPENLLDPTIRLNNALKWQGDDYER